jgi:hypothetical protein
MKNFFPNSLFDLSIQPGLSREIGSVDPVDDGGAIDTEGNFAIDIDGDFAIETP